MRLYWDDIKKEHNLVRLLNSIKYGMQNQLQNNSHTGLTAYDWLKSVLIIRKQRIEETAYYRKKFTSATEVL